ncbi:hypothetical protein BDZ89DRAFT_697564 [Hymenopellis radicata]|nr:hypothetical protein BDZ89DRAFT_697564 [Hymenopellis radicata]
MDLRAGRRRGRIQPKKRCAFICLLYSNVHLDMFTTPVLRRRALLQFVPPSRAVLPNLPHIFSHVHMLCPFPVAIQQGGHQLCVLCASCTSLPLHNCSGGRRRARRGVLSPTRDDSGG